MRSENSHPAFTGFVENGIVGEPKSSPSSRRIGEKAMTIEEESEYDFARIARDERSRQQRSSGTNRQWKRGVMFGLILGVSLCAGTTYAVYYAEVAYESTLQFHSPVGESYSPDQMGDRNSADSAARTWEPRRRWGASRSKNDFGAERRIFPNPPVE